MSSDEYYEITPEGESVIYDSMQSITYQATVSFRWVIKNNAENELQQAWQGSDGTFKWEPVPVIKEEDQ